MKPRAGGKARARTTFVGRRSDLAAIARLVEEGAQLVTLVGPPGIGKTRLSIEAARSLGGDATFCDLGEARDAGALLLAVALALGASVEAAGSEEALAALVGRALSQRGETLVVLDNAEQVVEAAAGAVERWMEEAPGAVFLVTSRERLRVAGEHVLALEPLGLPALRETSPERLLAAEAVTLLVDRARAVRPSFAPGPEDAAALAEIARRVEGVPLALELCAARLAMLSPRQLLARLSRKLDVLASDLRGAPGRQATLRGAVEWSWELLDAAERSVLAQCSVFRGGFDLDAAEAVLRVGPAGAPALELLSALRDKSLLVASAGDERGSAMRYRLYESVREFAAEKLAGELAHDGAASGAAERHAAHFTAQGERWAAAAKGAGFEEGLAALARESDNLLAAREHDLSAGRVDRAMEATLCFEPLAIVRGPVLPYLALLSATLEAGGERLSPRLAGRALGSLGVAESRRGRPAEAIACFERAVEIATACGDAASLPFLLAKLGNQRCATGEDAAAESAFQRARELLDAADDPAVRGVFCRHRAFFLWRAGRVAEARAESERARALLSAHGDRRELAYVLCDLAATYLDTAELDAATSTLDDAVDLLRRLQYRRVEGRALLLAALARREQGRWDEARSALDRALSLHVEDGDRGAEGFALWHLACLALEQGDAASARGLAEQALARYREMGDAHLIAHGHMVLGAALALAGEPDAAEAELQEAGKRLGKGGGPARDALALFAALVPLARSREAPSSLRAQAERALRDLDAQPGTKVASVRFARRVLERALAAGAEMAATAPPISPATLDLPPSPPHPAADAAPKAAPRSSRTTSAALVVSDDGRWFRLSERREVSLERRAALRRILSALAQRRVLAPGTALSLDEVLAAGWPGERVSAEAGAARVYNAIQRLRRLGLGDVLRTRDDGYLLDVETSTAIAARVPETERNPGEKGT
jgi:predicted ATPase